MHVIQGTARPSRMKAQGRDLEPNITASMSDAPEWLPAGAAQEWGHRAAVTPWLKATDEPAFFGYCVQRDQINRAVRENREITPATWTAFKGYCQMFGFDPSSRAKQQMPTEEKPANKFAKLGS